MEIACTLGDQTFFVDLSKPIDLSLPVREGMDTASCFYAPPVEMEPYRSDFFTGSVAEGGVVNYYWVRFYPHGNGTHTESLGHLTADRYSVQEALQEFHFPAQLISVYPEQLTNGDRVITLRQLEGIDLFPGIRALIIRTLPNGEYKRRHNYSGGNPPYLDLEVMEYIVEAGIAHLLIDLPSVDREEDGGALVAHRCFWQLDGAYPRKHATITELIYVENTVRDGLYLLNIQLSNVDMDASPSKPVIYSLCKK
ncbi:MAG: cyclase family protein [Saprospiraceae bacterium]|jgi:arylformamidase|nr:cyclase family protein [Saprospiraceae bacterium]MDP4820523.1 cyclase family protein [Saprospiraceae bacterium]MDP4997961.1 cyclase family protein [Saprospiraceae bacterium]